MPSGMRIRRYIQYHEWMNDVKGERIGIFEIVYNPGERKVYLPLLKK